MGGNRTGDSNPEELPFTDGMIRVLAEARAESYHLRHEFLGTEHLVLALTHPDSVDGGLLTRLGIDRDRVRGTLTGLLRPGNAAVSLDAERPYTTRTKKAFLYAAESARDSGHAEIGPEHVIVGLMREGLNPGAQVLNHHGLTVDKATAAIRAGSDGNAP